MSRAATLEKLQNATPLIAPSMLKCNFGDLGREISLLEAAHVEVLHLDVMDGHFVPNLSYGPLVIERLRPLTNAVFDAHLMISEPDRYLDEYLKAGCDCVTFHIEAVPEPAPLLQRIRDADAVSGLALNPGTPIEKIEPYLSDCDLVLVMSVEPGFGGQKFLPASLEKLKWLTESSPVETLRSIDGGIASTTIGDAARAGANMFVAGSAIFDSDDYVNAIQSLTEIAEQNPVSSSMER
jgi:ribulose-phosphate 3-epimerase